MILGIDPGLANIGWAVLQSRTDKEGAELVDFGVIETKEGESAERLMKIYEELEKIIEKYKVKEVAIESLFFAKNAKSAIKVAEAIGVIRVCSKKRKVEVYEYTPLQVKMALAGYGRAEKEQVEAMVRQELGLEKIIRPSHAADAAAVALTHMFSLKI